MSVRVAITMGDPAGIGPEVVARAAARPLPGARYLVIGDAGLLRRCGLAEHKHVTVCDLGPVSRRGFSFGAVSACAGRACIEYLDCAMGLLREGAADCLVTAPICKEAVRLAGYTYSGHTEYLARHCGVPNPLMMLLNNRLRFGLVTRHIPLRSVASVLSGRLIAEAAQMSDQALRLFFGIRRPRICVCALNPHASDNGVIGREENALIRPVVARLARRFPGICGPEAADSAVAKAAAGGYDCLLALYHDQALIPLKLTGAASGVNLTAGLSFVRTSPLHGTAFDIAGKGKADPSSMIAAISCALRCCRNLKKA